MAELFVAHNAVHRHGGAELQTEQDELDDGPLERSLLFRHRLGRGGGGPEVVDVKISHLQRRSAERIDERNDANGQSVIRDGFVDFGKCVRNLWLEEGFQKRGETHGGETDVKEDSTRLDQGELVQERQNSAGDDLQGDPHPLRDWDANVRRRRRVEGV